MANLVVDSARHIADSAHDPAVSAYLRIRGLRRCRLHLHGAQSGSPHNRQEDPAAMQPTTDNSTSTTEEYLVLVRLIGEPAVLLRMLTDWAGYSFEAAMLSMAREEEAVIFQDEDLGVAVQMLALFQFFGYEARIVSSLM